MASKELALEDTELVLRTLALNGNSPMRTREALETIGHTYTDKQITYRRDTNLDRFHEIRTDLAGETGMRMAEVAEDLAREAYAVQALAVEQTRVKLEAGQIKDPSAAAKNLATTAQVAMQSAALIRGQPTQIVEMRNAEEILASLASKLPPNTVLSTAVEEETHG